jgi:glutathione S-transferase
VKLFFAGNSPYARRARLAVRASGLGVEEVDIAPLIRPDQPLLQKGPGGKVPALETDSGAFFCETLIITNYLNEKSGGRLLPANDAEADATRALEGLGSLLMDSLFVRSAEKRKEGGAPWTSMLEKETGRAARCYDALEAAFSGQSPTLNVATIAAVSSLGYADWRLPDDNWREGRAGLSAWFDAMHTLPDVTETKPVF